ncbi:ankyrin repeat protein, putative [Trichomonas vaginalis G3]|uniref:Ankyrin repeat protein, putative n=1 Tax=Trichomonas vaginalis (strain ATCC PRA-98 / G3) TaxID=412133 RepID=A2DBP4_TRIV3|nr:protein ubiquitination [Trichomonas vaginalis G3]EAY22247.1 ankyrin repeat protein, putative [Trichomonas vaginalis G3]KAI5533282.1 protein ubiquitination [Trichomonas vaginalis G3]|eukprot:XP_001583233.1 ankyrin repeat protein [Trichomonas vaginalis G3]
MSQSVIQNYEYTASHISDYIIEGNFFDIFEIKDIKKIMKISNLTANDFTDLLQQSHHTIKTNELYACTRNSNIHIQNMEDVISTLKSMKEYMKLRILGGIIDFLDHKANEILESTARIQKLQTELNEIQKQKQKSDNNVKSLQFQLNQINEENTTLKRKLSERESNTNQNEGINADKEILSKISKLKESDGFQSIYKFIDELSSQENQKMISKACEEGLWERKTPKSQWSDEKNVLHVASEKGNFKLVKSLIECGCDKESKSKSGYTPLIYASQNGKLEVVQYLISVGADKEAKDNEGNTSLMKASEKGHFEIIKYLISVGADKDAKSKYESTPLMKASMNGHLEVVKYLISVGADKEAKSKSGYTPLIYASQNGKLEVVQYLISVGADKEAKNNSGYTPLIYASQNGKLEVVQYLISVGANKETKNNEGKTAFDKAKSNARNYLLLCNSINMNKETAI